jgi:hypothetical protein
MELVGREISVYEDPMTEQVLEGRATIRKAGDPHVVDPQLSLFFVHFIGDDEGEVHQRYVRVDAGGANAAVFCPAAEVAP